VNSKAETLAEAIWYNHDDEDQAKENAQELLSLIPTFTENNTRKILYYLGNCVDEPAWRREIAGSVAEAIITKTPNPTNPLTLGIRQMLEQIEGLSFSAIDFIPSFIQFIVLGSILLLFLMLWPYGLAPVVAGALWKIILLSRFRMKFRTRTSFERMPYTVAIGIYFLTWLPFALLCLPFVMIGWVGEKLADWQ
jgi:hypothetical protein